MSDDETEPNSPGEFISATDIAKLVGVSVDTIEKWRADGYGPRWYRLPGLRWYLPPGASRDRGERRAVPRYRRQDVLEWIERCAVETRAPMPPRARRRAKR